MDPTSQLMFALQSPIGLRFGATRKVDAERITFEMDVVVPKGATCGFRLELTGLEETVMGVITIDRLLPKRQGSVPSFSGKIIEMPEEDRKIFDGWRRDQATGGISRRIERDPSLLQQQMLDQMSGATEAETRHIMERINSRRINQRIQKDMVQGDPFGLSDEKASEGMGEAARSSMRDALKAGAENLPEEAPEVVVEMEVEHEEEEVVAPPPPAPAPAAKPAWLRENSAAPETPVPPPVDPTPPSPVAADAPDTASTDSASEADPVLETAANSASTVVSGADTERADGISPPLTVLDEKAQPMELSIVYLNYASFAHDWNTHLASSGLTVDHPALETMYAPLKVTIRSPSGDEFVVMGQTVSKTSSGTAIALELNTRQRLQLAAEASKEDEY